MHPWHLYRKLFLLFVSAVALSSCAADRHQDFNLRMKVDGQYFVLSIDNSSGKDIFIQDRILGLNESDPIEFEVYDHDGNRISRCTHIDYFSEGIASKIPSGSNNSIRVPVSMIYVTYCLKDKQQYRIRALLVVDGEVVARDRLVDFRAESPSGKN